MKHAALFSKGFWFAASLLLSAMPAFAGPVRVALTATVADVWDPDGVLGGTISAGDAVSGSYAYDAAMLKTRSGVSAVAEYRHRAAPFGIEVRIGRSTFKTDPDRVEFFMEIIDNYSGRDGYLVRSDRNLALPNGVVVDQIAWRLDDVSQRALSSVDLPAQPPSLASWQSIFGLSIEGHDPSEPCKRFFLRAHVTSAR